MNQAQESVLLRTSAGTDVVCSGGVLTIAGLPTGTRKNRISSIVQIKAKAEVVQVVTVGATAYTPTGSTRYQVMIGDTNRIVNGAMENLTPYSFVTAPDVTVYGNAAAQREVIHLALVAAINAKSPRNFVVAASLGGGTGFTITDTAGYYPVFNQLGTGRLGASQVVVASNPDDTGFLSTNISITTQAVFASGIGADLAASVPVIDALYGGLLSGYLRGMLNGVSFQTKSATAALNNLPAVAGQLYDIFVINSLADAQAHNQRGQLALIPKVQFVAVDNGAGTTTTNLAGFLTFERELRKNMIQQFCDDPSEVVQWYDQSFLEQAPLGAVPSGTSAASNTFISPYGSLTHYQIGTQTIVTGAQGANGFLIEQDLTATEGAAYFPNLATPNSQQFMVGKSAITVTAKASFTTPANIVFLVGLRAKEAAVQAFGNYTKQAFIGTGAAGTAVTTYGALTTGTTTTNATPATNLLTTVQYDFRIQVAIDGTVTAFINGSQFAIYSSGTTPLVFATGTILIPHLQYTNLNSATAVANVTEFWAVASDNVIL